MVFFFFLCTPWIFIAIASLLLSADLSLTWVGVLLLERVWNAQLRTPWCYWRGNFALSLLHAPGFTILSFSLYFLSSDLASHIYALIVNFNFGVSSLLSLNLAHVVLFSFVLSEVCPGVVFPLSQQVRRWR